MHHYEVWNDSPFGYHTSLRGYSTTVEIYSKDYSFSLGHAAIFGQVFNHVLHYHNIDTVHLNIHSFLYELEILPFVCL